MLAVFQSSGGQWTATVGNLQYTGYARPPYAKQFT